MPNDVKTDHGNPAQQPQPSVISPALNSPTTGLTGCESMFGEFSDQR